MTGEEIAQAIGPIVHFLGFVEALEEIGDIDPITDSTVITQISGGGGHATLTVGDLRKARNLIQKDPDSDMPQCPSTTIDW